MSSKNANQSNLSEALRRVFIEPRVPIQDIAIQRKSRLLSTILLTMFVLFVLLEVGYYLTIPGYQTLWIHLAGYTFLASAYLLNRFKSYFAAATLVMIMFVVVLFAQVLGNVSRNPEATLMILILGLLLGSILLTARWVAIWGIIFVAGILMMPFLAPAAIPAFSSILRPLVLNVIATALALLFLHHRDQIEKDRQAELREREELLRLALSAAKMGTWSWHIETNEVKWSADVEPIFGLKEGEFARTYEAYLEMIHPDDKDYVLNTIEEALQEASKEYFVEHRVIWPDGGIHWIEGKGKVFCNPEGKLERMTGTVVDTTLRKQTEIELQKTSEQLRALAAHLQSVREEERTAIAREMHDELGQDLTAFKMDLTFLEKQIRSAKKNDSDHLRSINDLKILIDKTVHKVRTLIRYLRPEVLDDLGLIEALAWQANEFKSRTGIDIKFKSNIKKIKVDKKTSTAFFRIFQEALTNIARHAKATHVEVNIEKKERIFSLQVTDNGVGVTGDIADKSKTFGLLGMQERAVILGGDVEINGVEGKGTTVTARIPIAGNGSGDI